MRKNHRQRSIKLTGPSPSSVSSPFRKEFLQSNLFKKKTPKLKISQQRRRRVKKEHFLEDLKGQHNVSSVKWRANNKENSKLKTNNHTELSIEKNRRSIASKRHTFSEKFNSIQKEKLMFINNIKKPEDMPELKRPNRSTSNKISKLKRIFKDGRRNTCHEQLNTFGASNSRSKARNTLYNDSGYLLDSIYEKEALCRTIKNLSTVNESSVQNHLGHPTRKERSQKLKDSESYLQQSIFQTSKNRKLSKQVSKRTSFYKKNKEFLRLSRQTCDSEFQRLKDLSSISFFNMNSGNKDFYKLKSIQSNKARRSVNELKWLEDNDEPNPRETGMFPKIQRETNHSFVR